MEDDLRRILEGKYIAHGVVCTGHDLAPIFEAAFGMKWDKKKQENRVVESGVNGLVSRKWHGKAEAGGWGWAEACESRAGLERWDRGRGRRPSTRLALALRSSRLRRSNVSTQYGL